MRYLFSFKKDVLGLLLLCAIAVSSCTNEDEVLKSNKVEPGIYMIEKTIDAQNANAQTRGISNNNDFDLNYDPDYIYLHCGGDSLRIPVYADCSDCDIGFHYRIEVKDDGSAIITPINEEGEYMTETLTIPQDSTCYFSSWESCKWELPENQISKREVTEDSENEHYYFYHRKNDINTEIYRSVSNYSISDLVSNGDLVMGRGCAAFNLLALFYDAEKENDLGVDGGYVTFSESEFEAVMGDSYSNWYVKIYIGGKGFTEKYDFKSMASVEDVTYGYYASEDSATYASGLFDSQVYLPFIKRTYGADQYYYEGFGYYTRSGNQLFTPVNGEEVNVYVLIKHWTGDGDPNEDWLLDDTDAIYTKVDYSASLTPVNNVFYTYGLLMDINLFKDAWNEIWNTDAGVEGSGDEQEVLTRSLESTRSLGLIRSLGLKASREFFLKDAKVICESH